MKDILCSIIIPYYNVQTELVNRCLNSILNQEWNECLYEVIFINDGSQVQINNSTLHVFDKFSLFTLIEQENQGLSAARNAGINVAQGKYLFFVDSDDYWFDYKIHELIPYLKSDKYDIIKFQTRHLYNNTNPTKQTSKQTYTYSTGCKYMQHNNIIKGAWTYCYRRNFILQHQIFMPEGLIHEDEWFLTISFFHAKECLFTSIPLYAYIRREGSIMSIKTIEQWKRSFNDLYTIINKTVKLKHKTATTSELNAIDNRLTYLLYAYIYNSEICILPKEDKHELTNRLKEIKLYPLPRIGNNKKYDIVRFCSKNKLVLKLILNFIRIINNHRVKGKTY